MKKLLYNELKTMDSKIQHILFFGLKSCFIICLIATLALVLFLTVHNPYAFYFGIKIISSSFFFIVFFIICSIFTNTINSHIN